MKLKLSLLFILLVQGVVACSQPSVNWESVNTSFQEFLEYPSSENAKELAIQLPDSGHIEYSNTDMETETINLIYENLDMLERQIVSRDKEAINLAFKLFSISSGHFTEILQIDLGKLIRIDPELFLTQLKKNVNTDYGLDGLLANLGPTYVDRIKAHNLEIELRIKALEDVSNPSLKSLKAKCIKELKS